MKKIRIINSKTKFTSILLALDISCGSESIQSSTSDIVMRNLIGDYIDRKTNDRKILQPNDIDTAYPIGRIDTDENAHPYTNGIGGSLEFTNSEIYLKKIGESDSSLLSSRNFNINGQVFKQTQNLWVSGSNKIMPSDGEFKSHGFLPFVTYSVKFDGPNSQFSGIPLGSYGAEIELLGNKWKIKDMKPPANESYQVNEVKRGGELTLYDTKGNELKLVNSYYDKEGFSVVLGWKLDENGKPSLRSINLEFNVSERSTSGSVNIPENHSIQLHFPFSDKLWKLKINGLDTVSKNKLSYSIVNNENGTKDKIVLSNVWDISSILSSKSFNCQLDYPYLIVATSKGTFNSKEYAYVSDQNANSKYESIRDNSYFVSLFRDSENPKSIICDTNFDGRFDNNDKAFEAGTVIMKSVSGYGLIPYSKHFSQEFTYPIIGGETIGFVPPANGGSIVFKTNNSLSYSYFNPGIGSMIQSAGYSCYPQCQYPHYFLAFSENAGAGFNDYIISGINLVPSNNRLKAEFVGYTKYDNSGTREIFFPDSILYGHAVNSPLFYLNVDVLNLKHGWSGPLEKGIEAVKVGYITERGTKINYIGADYLEFLVNDRVANITWSLVED